MPTRYTGIDTFWLNPDEGIYFTMALRMSWDEFWYQVSHNAHPPLYFLLVRALGQLNGDFLTLRYVSALFSALTIPGLFLLVKEWTNSGIAVIAAALLLISPAATEQAQLIRPYSFYLFVLTLTLLFLVRYTKRGETVSLAAFGVGVCILTLTHYATFILFAAGATVLSFAWFSLPRGRAVTKHLCLATLPGVVLGMGLLAAHIWPSLLGSQLQQEARDTWLAQYFSHDAADLGAGAINLLRYLFGAQHELAVLIICALGVPLAVLRGEWLIPGLSISCLGFAMLASITGFYPFGGVRHDLFLIIVIIPYLAWVLWVLCSGRAWWNLSGVGLILLTLVFAQPVRDSLGLSRIVDPRMREQVTIGRDIESVVPAIHAALDTGSPVFLDTQTFYLLAPLFDPASSPVRYGQAFSFVWRGAPVLVHPVWALQLEPVEKVLQARFSELLDLASTVRPDLRIASREQATIVLAGWRGPGHRDTSAISERFRKSGCLRRAAVDQIASLVEFSPRACRKLAFGF